ncbi:DUF6752 domain-containing protein [Nocardioides daphniae]|uniref:DUF6752 domain-containing protein n=1 Tax=Nocardioides daphniae TaxID=402297 RepID=A0A4P7UC98_9ACTN|nr:DUF6752 domain-containing protein [Nocardioides daphniae]QCC77822.1 hypothetical protein E2C04_12695 [Nocardioides daphniae]
MDKVKQLLKSSLRARVEVLEQEVQESRQLNMRLAELLDVVTELLVPLAERERGGGAPAARRLPQRGRLDDGRRPRRARRRRLLSRPPSRLRAADRSGGGAVPGQLAGQ